MTTGYSSNLSYSVSLLGILVVTVLGNECFETVFRLGKFNIKLIFDDVHSLFDRRTLAGVGHSTGCGAAIGIGEGVDRQEELLV
ncbi:hypothetical protein EDD16DRAFT_1583357 [Pisolithus croceorrhizus]|nr:hypothetical protein EDD16DRAFT_1583357 [Pisolithus croceorrhizus]